jgi:hypothetical protein
VERSDLARFKETKVGRVPGTRSSSARALRQGHSCLRRKAQVAQYKKGRKARAGRPRSGLTVGCKASYPQILQGESHDSFLFI